MTATAGSVASPSDPIDSTQYTKDGIRAAVWAANDWNTYVCAHVYTSKGIRRCIRTGVE